jgi:alpha-tubulin suppressor-like RCC1 family protein
VKAQINKNLLLLIFAIIAISIILASLYLLGFFEQKTTTTSTSLTTSSILTTTSSSSISTSLTYTTSSIPVSTVETKKELKNVVAISAGEYHTCALLKNGSVKCWGDNSDGQLGDGTTDDKSTPVTVVGISNAIAISAGRNLFIGGYHTCALLRDGSVKCWGNNLGGQLGDGKSYPEENSSLTPVTVVGISNAIAVSAGGDHTCALLRDGSVKCWGDNFYGQLGDGKSYPKENRSLTPVTVVGISNAIAIATGHEHTCALLRDGSVKCWGDNLFGQLGDGTTHDKSTPVTVVGISNAIAISAGDYHTCALLSNGSVKCWGGNDRGQLGDETTAAKSTTPVTVVGISNAIAVSAGGDHTCALLSNESVKCWGDNSDGQLGDGKSYAEEMYSRIPVTVIE